MLVSITEFFFLPFSSFRLQLLLEVVELDVGEVDLLLDGHLAVLAVPGLHRGDLGQGGALHGRGAALAVRQVPGGEEEEEKGESIMVLEKE